MPDVREFTDEVESIASTAEDDHQVELLLAGFRACAKEAIRFLLEEEGLAPDHELPVGLQEHLDRQQSHLAGMLHSDSGLEIDSSCCSSADNEPFVTVDGEQQNDLANRLQNDSRLNTSGNCYGSSSHDMSFVTSDSRLQSHMTETQQNDSGLNFDATVFCSSVQDTSFTTSEIPNLYCRTEVKNLNDNSLSNDSS